MCSWPSWCPRASTSGPRSGGFAAAASVSLLMTSLSVVEVNVNTVRTCCHSFSPENLRDVVGIDLVRNLAHILHRLAKRVVHARFDRFNHTDHGTSTCVSGCAVRLGASSSSTDEYLLRVVTGLDLHPCSLHRTRMSMTVLERRSGATVPLPEDSSVLKRYRAGRVRAGARIVQKCGTHVKHCGRE